MSVPGRGSCPCKGPEAGTGLVCEAVRVAEQGERGEKLKSLPRTNKLVKGGVTNPKDSAYNVPLFA